MSLVSSDSEPAVVGSWQETGPGASVCGGVSMGGGTAAGGQGSPTDIRGYLTSRVKRVIRTGLGIG